MALLLWISTALAEVPVRVAPGDVASALVLVESKHGGVVALSCADGAPPDDRADGIWACGDVDAAPEAAVVLVDERGATEAGTWGGGAAIVVVRSGGSVVVASDTGLLPSPRSDAPIREAGAWVAARVTSPGGPDRAPAIQLGADGRTAELRCRDDGGAGDESRNDGVHGCLGLRPADTVAVTVDGQPMGSATFSPGELGFLSVDGPERSVSTTAFTLRLAADAPDAEAPAPPPASGGPTPDAPARTAPGLWGGLSLAAVVAAFAAGRASRTAPRLPKGLDARPAPLIPGGPPVGGPPVTILARDPDAAFATVADALSRAHRVLVVPAPGRPVPATPGIPVWIATERDQQAVARIAAAFARLPGAPPAVVVIGVDTLADPAGIVGDAPAALARGLGRATPLVLLSPLGAASPFPTFELPE